MTRPDYSNKSKILNFLGRFHWLTFLNELKATLIETADLIEIL